jgi:Zn-dependent protease
MPFNLANFIMAGVIRLAALLPALTLHEFAHAWSADRSGDPTPRMRGRLTLNPVAHLDPLGTLAILILPIGWAKPVPINPMNFRNGPRDAIFTSAMGPLSNIVQGTVWCLIFRALLAAAPGVVGSMSSPTMVGGFLGFMAFLNFVLALFNLIPIGVLDGHHIMENALPYPASESYRQFNHNYGMAVLLGIIGVEFFLDIPILQTFLVQPAMYACTAIAGVNPVIYALGSGVIR